ncbi:Predicted arabinose efflux permease, MFS family [Pseudonocardia ammonioxydans]|uniref:Predicted arabinose efflux permease, MFS family n=1 Tax=Pseudonocardia ammonioxydans TaxID=260086 RepID=A0A1I5EFG8_PSUAM|nr:MFS transporter [Pseudonocardia ammonioxydans]SFO09831.1 Predicted arabinose efflux permease, MFS family [Pseudonocardia ammonioxydans]
MGALPALRRGALFAGAFLGPFGGGLTAAMLPELGADFGVPTATASVSITAYLLPFAGAMLVSGTLGERWGRARTVVAGYALYVVASLACVLAASWTVFLAGRALQGLANAFTTPLLLAALAAAVEPDRLGRALGWFGSLQAAGQTSAPLFGGLAAEVDWRLSFGGAAAVALLLAAVGIPGGAAPAPRGGPRPRLRSAWSRPVLRLGLVAGLGWGCLAGLNFLLALRLEEDFGLGAGPRGLVLTALGVAGILTARLIGGAVDRLGPRRCVLAGAVGGGVLVALMGFVPLLGAVVACWALGGVCSQLILVGVNALVLGSGLPNSAGAISVVQAVRFAGTAASPVALTPVYHADPLAGFLVPAGLLVAGVPAVLALDRDPGVSRG